MHHFQGFERFSCYIKACQRPRTLWLQVLEAYLGADSCLWAGCQACQSCSTCAQFWGFQALLHAASQLPAACPPCHNHRQVHFIGLITWTENLWILHEAHLCFATEFPSIMPFACRICLLSFRFLTTSCIPAHLSPHALSASLCHKPA